MGRPTMRRRRGGAGSNMLEATVCIILIALFWRLFAAIGVFLAGVLAIVGIAFYIGAASGDVLGGILAGGGMLAVFVGWLMEVSER